MPEMTEAYAWHGRTLVDEAGDKLGKIHEIYEDDRTGKPEWALVQTGLFGTRSHFVPLAGASSAGEDVQVPVSKAQVNDAPSVDTGGQLSEEEERRLFDHYGVPYTEAGTTTAEGTPREEAGYRGGDDTLRTDDDTLGDETLASGDYEGTEPFVEDEARTTATGGATTGRDVSGPTTDDAMTRSEEELRVGTERREAGRVRLRKYVVTEPVTRTVQVQREEVRLEREPITEANRGDATAGPEISDEEHEVTLHEEEPVVEKRVVPRERVRLATDVVDEEREVTGEVRKERVETDAPEADRGLTTDAAGRGVGGDLGAERDLGAGAPAEGTGSTTGAQEGRADRDLDEEDRI